MDVNLLYFDGCPNWAKAAETVRQAMREVGLTEQPLSLLRVETMEQALRLGFHGSPTVLLAGVDPFAHATSPVGLICRVYRTESGRLAGSPTVAQLSVALRARIRQLTELSG